MPHYSEVFIPHQGIRSSQKGNRYYYQFFKLIIYYQPSYINTDKKLRLLRRSSKVLNTFLVNFFSLKV